MVTGGIVIVYFLLMIIILLSLLFAHMLGVASMGIYLVAIFCTVGGFLVGIFIDCLEDFNGN